MSKEENETSDFCDTIDERISCFYPRSNDEESSLKESEDRYTVTEKIGEGGLKEIFLAFDHSANRQVALAYLREEASEHLAAFKREAKISALLEHPNIIPIYDTGEIEGRFYFTMRLIHGKDLTYYLKSREYSRNQFLRIFVNICDALAYAHSRGVIHLDLKPENIRIDQYGEVLVHDWGLAQRLFIPVEDKNSLVPDEVEYPSFIKGTPRFMAPEQLDPRSGSIDERTDVFALGCILLTLLNTDINDEYNFRSGKHAFNSKCPESLIAVANKALKLNPEERYDSVEEFKVDIERFLDGLATSAENPGFLKQGVLFYKRHLAVCNILLCSISILLIFISLYISNLKESKVQISKALEQASVAQERAEKALLESQENFSLYLKEKEERDLVTDLSRPSFSSQVLLPRKHIQQTVKRRLNLALKIVPDDPDLHRRKTLYHIFNEEFNQAIKSYENVEDAPFLDRALPILQKYAAMKKDSAKLNSESFLNLINELTLSENSWIAGSICSVRIYDAIDKNNSDFVKQLFKVTNPLQKEWRWSYSGDDGVVFNKFSLNGHKDIKCLTALAGRYVGELDLSNMGDLPSQDLSMIFIRKLKISGTNLSTYKVLKRIPGLVEIFVTKGQLSEEDAASINDVKISYVE